VDGLAAALVGDDGEALMPLTFYKMSGSGNDFVVFDARGGSLDRLTEPRVIEQICARGTGVGADGIVLLLPSTDGDVKMTYYNRDGSRAEMCGNAALCVTSLVARLDANGGQPIRLETDIGVLAARSRLGSATAEVEMRPVSRIVPDTGIPPEAGEHRIGFANAGVPHLVVLVDDLEGVAVQARGGALRRHRSLAQGANVNFVVRSPEGWAMRTYERGVEAETLACGTGAIAVATLLRAWGESGDESSIRTRSGAVLTVRLRPEAGAVIPTLCGEGRLVFVGQLDPADLPASQ
jgi:diaminopimelate epimerase